MIGNRICGNRIDGGRAGGRFGGGRLGQRDGFVLDRTGDAFQFGRGREGHPGGWPLSSLPGRGCRRARGRPGVLDAQRVLDNFQFGVILPGDVGQPAVVHILAFDAPVDAVVLGRADALNEGHGDL